MARTTRIFFVADLHGSGICWRKFINAARSYRADLLLVGGDIAAKTMTPVLEDHGQWTATLDGHRRTVATRADLERLENELRDAATVPFRTSPGEWAELSVSRERLDRVFEQRAVEELRGWLSWADERLRGQPTRLLLGLGNDDLTPMEDVIAADGRAELTDREIVRLDDRHEILTIPFSNPTPWHTHRELPEEEIARRIDALHAQLERPASAVFNIHVPPLGTPLDLAPRLDAALTKVMTPGGEPEMVHVGSSAVRAALERYQPLLGLHGHIHESRGTTPIARTLAINCGSAYTEGALLGALVDVADDRLGTAVLTTG